MKLGPLLFAVLSVGCRATGGQVCFDGARAIRRQCAEGLECVAQTRSACCGESRVLICREPSAGSFVPEVVPP
jgi:hypothetical protein